MEFPEPVEDDAECVLCGYPLAEWRSTSVPLFRLFPTPDGETPRDKPIA